MRRAKVIGVFGISAWMTLTGCDQGPSQADAEAPTPAQARAAGEGDAGDAVQAQTAGEGDAAKAKNRLALDEVAGERDDRSAELKTATVTEEEESEVPSEVAAVAEPMAEPEPERVADGKLKEMAPAGRPMPATRAKAGSKKSSGSSRLGGAIAGNRGRRHPGADSWAKTPPPPPADAPRPDTEGYDHIKENAFIAVADDPRSTFSIDVDTASYSNMRRFVRDGSLPPVDSVRIEEMVNYFSYDYDAPIGVDPFSMNSEVSACPWNEDNLLVSVGLQGQIIDQSEVPARNLVFLLDVSGSMNDADKLPLLTKGLGLLVNNLRENDRISIVVYAGASGVVLEPTSSKAKILDALNRLEAGGSTNGGEGIELAYRLAKRSFVEGGINRVILATDGDFNVGATSRGELMRLIETKRKSGVFLSVLGFGTGNMKDSTMEQIADKGNGNYAYIDSLAEAKKVLVTEAGATLVTIAKDVKIQVEFNPAEVQTYRLIGYENRKLAHSDFNNDKKDAGEIGAGHSVTALYEVKLAGGKGKKGGVDKLKYQDNPKLSSAATSGEMMTVKIRYKKPNGSKSKLLSFPITGDDRSLRETSKDYRFAAAVAEFGMLLRKSGHKGDANYDEVLQLAKGALGKDPHGHRQEFIKLVKKAKTLARNQRGTLARAE